MTLVNQYQRCNKKQCSMYFYEKRKNGINFNINNIYTKKMDLESTPFHYSCECGHGVKIRNIFNVNNNCHNNVTVKPMIPPVNIKLK